MQQNDHLPRHSDSFYFLHFKAQSELCKTEPQDSQQNSIFTLDLRRFLKCNDGNSDKSIHCKCSWILLYLMYNTYDIIAVFLCIHNGVIYVCPKECKYFWFYFADLSPNQDGVDHVMLSEQYAHIFVIKSSRLIWNNTDLSENI